MPRPTRKSLEDHGDKVDGSTVEAIELAIGALEDALKTEDAGKIKGGIQNVMDASMRLGEAIYKSQQASGGDSDDDGDGPRSADEDIVDADFEDLGEDKKRG
jgi:molecular chaperone DnaK